MKRNFYIACLCAAVMALATATVSAKTNQKKGITTKGNTTIVNTRGVVKGVKGYASDTPVKIFIEKGKIKKVEAQPNQETPSIFANAEALLKKFTGKTVSEAQNMKVDAVTGATYSSKALIKTVKEGLKYYENNKK